MTIDLKKASAKELIDFISNDLEYLLSSGVQDTPSTDAQNIGIVYKWWIEYRKWLLISNEK